MWSVCVCLANIVTIYISALKHKFISTLAIGLYLCDIHTKHNERLFAHRQESDYGFHISISTTAE